MISHSSSVLFVSIFFIVCCYLGLTKGLKILILSPHMIFKCPTDEYLVIRNWEKFQALNLSCPNQSNLSDLSLDLIDTSTRYSDCNHKNRSFLFKVIVTGRSSSGHDINNVTDEHMQLLSSKVFIENRISQFVPTRISNSDKVLLYNISIEWTSNRQQTLYTLFQEQPIACVFYLNFTELTANEICNNNETIKYDFVCYHDPSSASPLQNVNWTFINDLALKYKYLPKNWTEKGAILYSTRSEITTMALTTTDLTSSSSTDVVTTSPMDSTASSSTNSVTTSFTDSTLSSSVEVTSMRSTDETSILSTITTTALHTSLTSTSTTDTTSISSTDMTSMTSTDTTTVTITTITTITTSTKIKKVTMPKPQKTQTPPKKPPKIKPAQNHSGVSEKPTGKKKPSSPPLLLIFLLVAFICAIAGLGVFFIIRYLKKQHSSDDNDEEDPALLDRVDSDEANNSEMDESETSTVMEAPQQSYTDQVQPKTTGRMVNRFDPDNM